ncbi:tumor necrosis factor alpha-induced protein 2 [Periophthalmus magnuspinnatus]|uniref:tumor necrosis factor alpha-induced protein 2 n=1 Tax=Periophthalmus magnuspinnatus TaxID=409849 RepID=UPI00145B678F|nr:tumor necrosis factor alpha-induced protein 2 [Periophthalmus magnuspinnatus]
MRLRSGSADSHGGTLGFNFLPEFSSRGGVRGRLQRLFRGTRSPANVAAVDANADANANATKEVISTAEEPEELYTFKDHLEQQRFSEVSQLLIDEENELFLQTNESVQLLNSATDELQNSHQKLEEAILKTIRLSLNRGEVSPEVLRSAVTAMCKETDQDLFWIQQRQDEKPKWRPSSLQNEHDKVLNFLVDERMDNPTAPCCSPETVQGSSIQTDVWGMGRQVKQDLETVVEVIRTCYPKNMDICNIYAKLFHNALGTRLQKIAEFGLDDKDCTFILRWVNEFYPQILQKPTLSEHIRTADLNKLLPSSLLQPLEEQYLSKQKTEMLTYISEVLNAAKELWTNGEMPKTEDGCFISYTAYDIIQVVNGAVTSSETVLGDRTKAQSLTTLLPELLQSYKSFLDDVIRSSKSNSGPTVKANLHCIQQFRNVLVGKSFLFPDEVRAQCLSILKEMQESAQSYLLSPVHAQLKPLYRKLSSDWLKGAQFKKILENIESKSSDLQGLALTSHQELMGRFHLEVSVEYVKRLIRGEKLKDTKKQQEAHNSIQRDAGQLHQLFRKMGSQEEWLKDVLIRIAELLKLQDLVAVQMHVATMGTSYPDISEKHVSAILKLKSNFTKTNRQTVKETLRDILNESATTTTTTTAENTQIFFSLLPV